MANTIYNLQLTGDEVKTILDNAQAGIAEAASTNAFNVKNTGNTGGAFIGFYQNSSAIGYIGVDSSKPYFKNADGSASAILLADSAPNNGKLTLQINGTNKVEFTANTGSDYTFNVSPSALGLTNAMDFIGISERNPKGDSGAKVGDKTSFAKGNIVLYRATTTTGYCEYVNLDGNNNSGSWELLGDADAYAPLNHTHSYAGASTAGGVATAASKLDIQSAVGDSTTPVYFTASGVPSAIGYTIAKNVPSTAVFTDHTYGAGDGLSLNNSTFSISSGNFQSMMTNYVPSSSSVSSFGSLDVFVASSSSNIRLPMSVVESNLQSYMQSNLTFVSQVSGTSYVTINKIVGITASNYTALTSKDANTYYVLI